MLNIAQLERDLEAKKQEGLSLLSKTMTLAETENRKMTDEELAAITAITTAGDELKARIAQAKGHDSMRAEIEKLTAGIGDAPKVPIRKSLGEQFVSSEVYDFFRKGHHRTQSAWRSPSVELFAATLTTDPASGGALVIPDYQAGIRSLPTRRLVVADLLASGTTDSNVVTYMQETLFTNAAAAVAEGALKPESALTFAAVNDPVRKIAHWLPVTEEMLEDVAQIRSYIDARLRLGVQIAEEDELLNGTGVAPHILGLSKRPGLAADVVRVDPVTSADAIFVQIMNIFANSFLMPDGIIMNPVNWTGIALTKTTTGEYLAGGPFASIPTPNLWGLSVAVTPAQAAGVALVGAYQQAAQVFRKGGIRVEASNSHADFFIKNLVAIRAEERLALAVYRPGAIGEVTGLTGSPVALSEDNKRRPNK